MCFIKLNNVSVSFEAPVRVIALNDISISINKGDWLTVLGPSGSGKTTLLNIIGGLETITSGEVAIEGVLLNELSKKSLQSFRRNTVGYIFQDYRLFEQFSVIENIMLPQLPYRPRKELEIRAEETLEMVKMTHRRNHLPSTLSGGEKQRTAIARAILHKPDILLCDEPTGNLDEVNRENILNLLSSLHNEGMTIIIVTHDPYVAKAGGSQVYLRNGIIQRSENL